MGNRKGNNEMNRYDILETARESIRDRENNYGSPEVNYKRLASLMTIIMQDKLREGESISPADAIMVMCVVKISRLINQPDHSDSQADLAGYAAILSEVV
jgi:hypothetical protein